MIKEMIFSSVHAHIDLHQINITFEFQVNSSPKYKINWHKDIIEFLISNCIIASAAQNE